MVGVVSILLLRVLPGLWYRGGEHLIIACSARAMCSASWICGYGIGAVSILLLYVLPAGFLAMAGNTASWISGYGRGGEHLIIVCSASWISGYGRGGGVVHVFSVCAPVCWTCADITSGGGGLFMCSLCVPQSVRLVPTLRRGGCSCVLCECLSLLDLCVGGGGVFMCSL